MGRFSIYISVPSGIDIGVGGVFLDEIATRSHLFTHQHCESAVRLCGIGESDLLEHTVLRIHRGLPKLFGIHLSKTFVSLQHKLVAVTATAIVDKTLHLLVGPCVFLDLFFPLELHL